LTLYKAWFSIVFIGGAKVEIWRTDIWRADLSQYNTPGVQGGKRPVIIVQNDIGNKYSPVVSIISGTTVLKKNMKTHITLDERCGLEKPTVFMAEQPQTISKNALMFKIGEVPKDKMQELDKAIMLQMGLIKPFSLDYILELIDDMVTVDRLFSAGLGMEEDYRKKVRREKEITRYCADYGFSGDYYLNRYYYKRGVMCG
jgi:mRNA interferase MazF